MVSMKICEHSVCAGCETVAVFSLTTFLSSVVNLFEVLFHQVVRPQATFAQARVARVTRDLCAADSIKLLWINKWHHGHTPTCMCTGEEIHQ